MNRYTIAFAYAWYCQHWGPNHYSGRVARLRVHLGNTRFERADSDVKEAYGAIVRREERLYVGFQRLERRQPEIAPVWPGTRNMPGGDARAWLRSIGLLEAVEALA